MATAVFAKTLDNSQHSTPFIPESPSYALNSNRENLRTRTVSLHGTYNYLQQVSQKVLFICTPQQLIQRRKITKQTDSNTVSFTISLFISERPRSTWMSFSHSNNRKSLTCIILLRSSPWCRVFLEQFTVMEHVIAPWNSVHIFTDFYLAHILVLFLHLCIGQPWDFVYYQTFMLFYFLTHETCPVHFTVDQITLKITDEQHLITTCFSFNDSVNNSDCIMSNDRMISEQWIANNVEGSGRSLI
jgi:hypothetical protein